MRKNCEIQNAKVPSTVFVVPVNKFHFCTVKSLVKKNSLTAQFLCVLVLSTQAGENDVCGVLSIHTVYRQQTESVLGNV